MRWGLAYAAPVHVLVVDDNPELLDLVRRSLASNQCTVTTATNVATARDAVSKEEFDVIVLDLGLPDGSGMAFCRELRQSDVVTPLLILTAHSAVSERVSGLDAGADDFM